jgi:hypothetical protein
MGGYRTEVLRVHFFESGTERRGADRHLVTDHNSERPHNSFGRPSSLTFPHSQGGQVLHFGSTRSSGFNGPSRIYRAFRDTSSAMSLKRLAERFRDGPPSGVNRSRPASKHLKIFVRSDKLSWLTCTNHAVINLFRVIVLKTEDVDQANKTYSKCIALRILIRNLAALAVLPGLPNRFSRSPSAQDHNALLT